MSAKTAFEIQQQHSAVRTIAVESEVVTVLAAGESQLPRRRRFAEPSSIERLIAALGSLIDNNTAIRELNFIKALEAKASASLRAMACDLESYALFASDLAAPALPASAERLTAWIDYLESAGQNPRRSPASWRRSRRCTR